MIASHFYKYDNLVKYYINHGRFHYNVKDNFSLINKNIYSKFIKEDDNELRIKQNVDLILDTNITNQIEIELVNITNHTQLYILGFDILIYKDK